MGDGRWNSNVETEDRTIETNGCIIEDLVMHMSCVTCFEHSDDSDSDPSTRGNGVFLRDRSRPALIPCEND